MSILHRWLSSGRVRAAQKRLAKDPAAQAYAELAQEHAVLGDLSAVLHVAGEGLKLYPSDVELKRLLDRARSLQLDGRMRELQQELRVAPRPALWKELAELLLASGRCARAEEVAIEWHRATKSAEANCVRARARAERFFADKRREDGRLAWELATACEAALAGDPAPLVIKLDIATRVGAWGDARRLLARLLELRPGDPALEARFRAADARVDGAKTLEQALREVERSGSLDGDTAEARPAGPRRSVRPLLQSLSSADVVEAAFYVRGATALVQGKRGATAERTARGVRDVVASCRSAARRLGLGSANEVCIEGDFGTLLVSPSENGSAALWTKGAATRAQLEGLRELVGVAADAEVDDA